MFSSLKILNAMNFEKISYSQLIKKYCLVSVLSDLPELLRKAMIRKIVSHNDQFNGANMSYKIPNVEKLIYLSWLSPDITVKVMLF